jgi:flagellar hook-associated protein FlgK
LSSAADKLSIMDLSISLGGMQRASASVDQAARRIASSTTPAAASPPADIVDLSAEMVALMQAKNAFTANANVARATSDMEQSLLNILA